MDAVIIGGGGAGLQVALTLGRLRFDVLFVAEAPAVVQALATGQRAAVGVTRDLTAATPPPALSSSPN